MITTMFKFIVASAVAATVVTTEPVQQAMEDFTVKIEEATGKTVDQWVADTAEVSEAQLLETAKFLSDLANGQTDNPAMKGLADWIAQDESNIEGLDEVKKHLGTLSGVLATEYEAVVSGGILDQDGDGYDDRFVDADLERQRLAHLVEQGLASVEDSAKLAQIEQYLATNFDRAMNYIGS